MKLTKYKHACFTVEIDGYLLVVDPGEMSTDFVVTENIMAVVVTHEHPDHFSPSILTGIHDKNPETLLLSTAEVIAKTTDYTSHAVQAGEHVDAGPFHLDFYGGKHASIYPSVPAIDNIGLMINNKVYYPGDSFVTPDAVVDTLAIPLGAPWLKTAEAIDFLLAVKPRVAFPTHDETLSVDGKAFSNAWLQRFADEQAIEYKDISGQTIDVS